MHVLGGTIYMECIYCTSMYAAVEEVNHSFSDLLIDRLIGDIKNTMERKAKKYGRTDSETRRRRVPSLTTIKGKQETKLIKCQS